MTVGRKFTARFTLAPPRLLDRVWYWSINETPPLSTASSGPSTSRWARLVPYQFRRFHRAYASTHGFYWLPCPLCGREHGGHEGGKTIPDPKAGPGFGRVICSACSRKQPRTQEDIHG